MHYSASRLYRNKKTQVRDETPIMPSAARKLQSYLAGRWQDGDGIETRGKVQSSKAGFPLPSGELQPAREIAAAGGSRREDVPADRIRELGRRQRVAVQGSDSLLTKLQAGAAALN